MATYLTITLNNHGATTAPSYSKLYYRTSSGAGQYQWYTTSSPSHWTDYITKVSPVPTRTYYTFTGYFTASSGGTRVTSATGGLYNTSSGGGALFTYASTMHAQWKRLSYGLAFRTTGTTSVPNGTQSLFQNAESGGWYTTWQCENAATSITPPSVSGYRFMGYWSGENGTGTKYINADGSFTDAFRALTINTTTNVYALLVPVYKVTVDADGGTGGTAAVWYDTEEEAFFSDASATQQITAITPPTKSGSIFLGCYDAATGGNLVVGTDGTIAAGFAPSAAATIYARWRTVLTITLDGNGGDGGDTSIIYDSTDGGAFYRPSGGDAIDAIDLPTQECYRFGGFTYGGTSCIDATGEILPALASLCGSVGADFTVEADWTRVSYKAAVEMQGGEGDTLSFYCDGSNATFYADDLLTIPLAAFPVPSRTGYALKGIYTVPTGGTDNDLAISSSGEFLLSPFGTGGMVPLSDSAPSITLYAQWTAKQYTVSFNYNGGSGSQQTKVVTFDQAIGTLPTATRPASRPDATFDSWVLNGEVVTASTVWRIAADATLTARWDTAFSSVTDWFNLASASLVPISSDAGDTVHRVTASHAGRYAAGVSEVGGIWRNPTTTYAVIKNTTLAVTLGKAYKGSSGVSGYMITSVEVSTEIGRFPTVTISATANEGANAINLFPVSVPIVARSKAQNLLNAVSGGGYLQRVSLVAVCDAVVCEENLMPCASDVVNGRYELAAETLAPAKQAAPTTGNGFAFLGAPKAQRDADYMRYSLTARKEMT